MAQVAEDPRQWQKALEKWCEDNGNGKPAFNIISDRRGGRTAWSSTVSTERGNFQARYWYDGAHIENAKEDAASVAFQGLGATKENQSSS